MIQFTPKKILQLLLVFLIAAFLICCLHSCTNDNTPHAANKIQNIPELKLVGTGPNYISLYQYTDTEGHIALIVYCGVGGSVSITKFR